MYRDTHTHTQTHTFTNILANTYAHYSLRFSRILASRDAHTYLSHTQTSKRGKYARTHSLRHSHTHTLTHTEKKKKPSWQASLCVFPGRSHFAMLTSFKCLQALMSYYGRQMACRTNGVSRLVSSRHGNHRNTFHLTVPSSVG